MFHILWSLLVGFIVGLIARALLPGGDQMGWIETTILGIVGSIVGGLVGTVLRKPAPGAQFHPAGFIMSIIGAVLALWIWRKIQ